MIFLPVIIYSLCLLNPLSCATEAFQPKLEEKRRKEGGEDRHPTLMGLKITKSVTAGWYKILNLFISWEHVEVGA